MRKLEASIATALSVIRVNILSTGHLSVTLLALAMALGASRAAGQQLPTPPERAMPSDLPMQSILFDAQRRAVEAEAAAVPMKVLQLDLLQRGITVRDDGAVHVEIVGPQGGQALLAAVIAPFGGQVTNTWKHRVDAWVPIVRLVQVGRALPKGYFIERAYAGEPDEVDGEGPERINSDSYRYGGANGTGLTIAVIDRGYFNLTAARTNGDAPPLAQTTLINYTGSTFESGGRHGTGCVEAAFDHCPGATWRIYKIDSIADMGTAVNNAISNGVDVITHSLSRYNQGWEDNTGDPCAAAVDAANAGMLFFTSAGNRANQHWKGDFNSGIHSAGWHDWVNGDEALEIVFPGCTNPLNCPGGSFYLSWDKTGGTYDYDLYLYDDTLSVVLTSSTNSGNTYEEFGWSNTSTSAVTVYLAVERASGGVTEFEVFLHGYGTWQEHIISESSTTSPSNATHLNVISNGAVTQSLHDSANGTDGIIAGYSSRGPSNSGMTLPDLSGPTDTSGFTYGCFSGTSCSTPNNAGAACAFWSADTNLSAPAVRWLMFEQGALWKDWGDPGKDNTYGDGGTILVDYVPDTLWVAREYGNIDDARDGPFFTVQAAHDAAVAGGRLLIFPGGTYPAPVVLDKRLTVETVENVAVLGEPCGAMGGAFPAMIGLMLAFRFSRDRFRA